MRDQTPGWRPKIAESSSPRDPGNGAARPASAFVEEHSSGAGPSPSPYSAMRAIGSDDAAVELIELLRRALARPLKVSRQVAAGD